MRLECNQGKRAALAAGFDCARGEIAVTIDSDSVIDAGTLLALAGPFRDPSVGAVAGKVEVLNRDQGLIPRMLQVRYLLSFDFLRAAQSMYRTVYCCPGALAAYRLSAVRAVLPRWLEQRFLGAQCTYGEDRALTNFILGEGYDTLYQSTAVVRTLVPLTYARLSKMFLRWTRSYIREDIRLARIVWRRPVGACVMTALDRLVTNLRYPIHYALIGLVLWAGLLRPALFAETLAGIGLVSGLYTLYYLRSERSWNLVYGIVYGYYSALTLFWIFPFAAFTLRSRAWLTR
jgi:hyaluronan synthase